MRNVISPRYTRTKETEWIPGGGGGVIRGNKDPDQGKATDPTGSGSDPNYFNHFCIFFFKYLLINQKRRTNQLLTTVLNRIAVAARSRGFWVEP